MQFSIVSTILLAQGIAAMPWSSIKAKQANGDEITLRIQVAQASSSHHGFTPKHKDSMNPKAYDICWAACFSEEPNCPEGWYSKSFNDECYTCCRGTDNDL